ncbi:MAG: toxin-antitoxin system YwqK family antitoxin [Saprospiraceae bacterium]|nr:toxin-antitoxin system YwqK family antitoxin [Saprospiraceae bacterium]
MKYLVGLSLLLFLACQENLIETFEQRDADGRLERYERNKKDLTKDGAYQRFSPDGKLEVEAHYKHDKLHGEKKYYFPDGRVESIEMYENDLLHGPYKKFYENGVLKIEQQFAQGLMQGISIRYYPNGKVEERVTIKDNEENGAFQEYYENGNLKAEGFYAPSGEESALEQGELKEYDESGTLIRIADCTDGRCLTRWKKN